MKKHPLLGVFILLSVITSGWSAYLLHLHNLAMTQSLQPGLLCGAGESCSQVLASDWSEIMGIPVSAPGVPAFFALSLLGVAVYFRKFDQNRLATLATAVTSVGALFGAALLYIMLVQIGGICKYCLVMDGLTLLLLGCSASLHSEGPGAAFSSLPRLFKHPSTDPLEAVLPVSLLLGTALTLAVFPPTPPVESEAVEVIFESEQPSASNKPSTPASSQTKTRRLVIPAMVHALPFDSAVPQKGPQNAPITLALFEDFQCPYCSKLAGNIEAVLAERDDVQVRWFHFPMNTDCNAAPLKRSLHPFACDAAIASVCAHRQGNFWGMHDSLFHNNAHLKKADLARYARQIGLNERQFNTCMTNSSARDKVRADSIEGAKLGISGTPTFFINGRKFSGAQPTRSILAAIDAIAAEPTERVLLDVPIESEIIRLVNTPTETISFSLDGSEHQIFAFEASLNHGKAVSRPGAPPASGLSWYDANAACKASGMRLCTEREWLRACTGQPPVDANGDGIFSNDPIAGRLHPYGEFPQETWCAASRAKDDPRPLITGEHPKCVTPDGIYDLEGLTKEWIGLSPDRAGLKGGSYYSRGSARCGYLKDGVAPNSADPSIGFRCCQGEVPPVKDHHPGGKVGDIMMSWEGNTLDGAAFSSSTLKGKGTIITFWASWCGPCRKELPALSELYKKYHSQGLEVIGVNVDTSTNKARSFLRQTEVAFPVVLDPSHSLQGAFDTRGVPTTFWVGREGQIQQRTIGYDDRAKTSLDSLVQALLSSP